MVGVYSARPNRPHPWGEINMSPTRAAVSSGGAMIGGGAGLIGWGISCDGRLSPNEALALGVLAVITAAVVIVAGLVLAAVRKAGRVESVAYNLGREMGYDQGWKDGRRATRPVAAPLSPHAQGVG